MQAQAQTSGGNDVAENSSGGVIGVVIPAFGHPQFLAEAIISACNQDTDQPVRVVVVDDGCRFVETGEVVANLVQRYPGVLFHLRQANTRLPGARNTGVRFLLQLEPDLDAVFFLDADNRIEPYSLRNYRAVLGDDSSVGWAYPDIAFFGLSWGSEGFDIRETAPDYSKLKHLAGNISEAGSLVRADVFRAGVFYDETMRHGFEDWDFWLSALGAGYTGRRVRHAGFLYRRRPESMLADSRRQEEELISRMHRKHADLFRPRAVMEQEQLHAPYYALVIADEDRVILTSDPLDEGREITKTDFISMAKQWQGGRREFFFPGGLLMLSSAHLAQLRAQPQYLRWLFWSMKEQVADFQRWVFEERPIPRLEAISPETPIMGNMLLYVSLRGLETLLVANGVPALELTDFRPYVMQTPLPLIDGHSKVEVKALYTNLLGLVDDMRQVPARARHISRRYAGPATANIRDTLINEICAEEGRQPYPAATGVKRILVAVDQAFFQASDTRASLIALLERLRGDRNEILLVLEQGGRADLASLNPDDWLPLVSDLILLDRVSSGEEYRMYLGRRIYSLFTLKSKEDGALLARLVDQVVCVGSVAFLEVLGDARQHGIKGYVYFTKQFADGLSVLSQDAAKVLAFEHAEERVIVDDEAVIHALAAQGFPPAKCISPDAFFDLLDA